MKPNIKTPRKFINPLLSRKSIDAAAFEKFKKALEKYQKTLDEQITSKQSEPNIVTNALKPFFDALDYSSQAYSQKGQSGIDLALFKNDVPAVIIEAKVPGSTDMISSDELNKKSLHEAILYFMRERDKGNHALFNIIITDFHNWFVFDAKDFEDLFWGNRSIKKLYDTYKNPTLLGDATKDFYQLIENHLKKDGEDFALNCAHFNLQECASEKDLIALYKLLSADNLLKTFNPNDANSLNREFYNELLYILGLEETKEGSKKVIGKARHPQPGTLFENVRNKLVQYQKPHEFEDIIKLIIIWMNRVLFLKLLESQIVKWHTTGNPTTDTSAYQFLSCERIQQYDHLETLFFDVLAKPLAERTMHDFNQVPYLNSSLFEIHPDEKSGITIATLTDDLKIDYYSKTVVKDSNRQRKSRKVSTLPYLLEFLDAYDFANDSSQELTGNTKDLISASVLGLIFEKINGYKDGSFYTPSFITMYMARETIEKAVIDKFNQAKGWGCTKLAELRNEITADQRNPNRFIEANALIDSLKICDPAVGSGHFLVSALNEILRIKSELGVLIDEKGALIDCGIRIENDDLIIQHDDGTLFEYKAGNSGKTNIQKTLFQEKQKIIENCLFGVDINPNSVNICRLRLWIELLKNAYYKTDGQLDTLPNIDINIKCGNSLISRFAIGGDVQLTATKAELQEYKDKVAQYKNNIGSKREVLQSIGIIKDKFQQTLKASHSTNKNLHEQLSEYVKLFGFDKLSNELKIIAFIDLNLRGKTGDMFAMGIDREAQDKKLKKVHEALDKKRDIEHGKIYEQAFEWRFEFPEVLNETGEFVGFDVVIGNPPYIDSESMTIHLAAERDFLAGNYELTSGNWDIYIAFFERCLLLSRASGEIALITPDKWLTKPFGKELRNKYGAAIRRLIKAGRDVFDSAIVDSLITVLCKSYRGQIEASIVEADNFVLKNKACVLANQNFSFDILFSDFSHLLEKVQGCTLTMSAYALCENACATSDTYKLKDFLSDSHSLSNHADYLKVVNTGTIGKYVSRYGERPMTYLKDKYLYPVVNRNNFLAEFPNTYGKKSVLPKIIGKGLTLLDWFIDTNGYFIPGKSTLVIVSGHIDSLKFLLAILNSNLAFFYIKNVYASASYNGGISFTKDMVNNLPIPEVDNKQQQEFAEKVSSILAAKERGEDTTQLEHDINQLVYRLYQLTPEEIAIIEKASTHAS